MKVSFEGIGQWCATFEGGVTEGHVVKVDSGGGAAECEAGDAFCGAAAYVRGDTCTVQLGGFVTVPYSGSAPALGYTALTADGKGGVQAAASGGQAAVQAAAEADGGQESPAVSQDAVRRWVVDRDEDAQTVTILL